MLQRINDHIMRAKTLPVNFKLFIKAVELRIAFIDVRLDERSLRIAFPFEPLRLPVRLRQMRIQPDDARIRNLNSELARLYHSTLTDCAAHWIIFSHQLSGGAPGNECARRRISVFGKL